jgi:hypothetical protein
MTDQGAAGGEVAKAVSDPFGTIFGIATFYVPEGPLRTLVLVVYGLCGFIAPFVFKYYLGVLAQGAKPEGSIERQDYKRLREGLAGDNPAARLYARWLIKFLDWIERFFGDQGMADRTLFPHAFGLAKPAPLWTAAGFDRCLLLAVIYPIAAILLIWTISGHVGPAEAALGLEPEIPFFRRGLVAMAAGFSAFALSNFLLIKTWAHRAGWFGAAIGGFVLAAADSGSALLCAVAVGGAIGVGVDVAGAIAVLLPFSLGIAVSAAGVDAIVGTLGACAASAGVVAALNTIAVLLVRQGLFLALFLPILFATYLACAELLSPQRRWEDIGPLLLFLGLLPMLNAPFDWASLGLTRALLRRGLERKGWWPYAYACLDAFLANGIIVALAVTTGIGVQAFDELAVHGGGAKAAVLPLDKLFDGIEKNPTAPEYWWAYALLLSTMTPSLVNLAIGGMALTRGVPGVSRLLLHWIPEGRDVPDYRRPLAALVLTGQTFAGVFLGIAAQAFLAWGILYHVLPWLGLDLLEMARAVADFDLPARVSGLFTGAR